MIDAPAKRARSSRQRTEHQAEFPPSPAYARSSIQPTHPPSAQYPRERASEPAIFPRRAQHHTYPDIGRALTPSTPAVPSPDGARRRVYSPSGLTRRSRCVFAHFESSGSLVGSVRLRFDDAQVRCALLSPHRGKRQLYAFYVQFFLSSLFWCAM